MKILFKKTSILSFFLAVPFMLSSTAKAVEDCPGYWVYDKAEKVNYCVGGDAQRHQLGKIEFMDYSDPEASQMTCNSGGFTLKLGREGVDYYAPASFKIQLVDAKGQITEVTYTADFVTQSGSAATSSSSTTSR